MPSSAPPELIAFGTLGRPHGLSGEMILRPFNDDGADLAPNVSYTRHKGGARSLGVAVTYRRGALCFAAAMPYNVVTSPVTPTPSAFT